MFVRKSVLILLPVNLVREGWWQLMPCSRSIKRFDCGVQGLCIGSALKRSFVISICCYSWKKNLALHNYYLTTSKKQKTTRLQATLAQYSQNYGGGYHVISNYAWRKITECVCSINLHKVLIVPFHCKQSRASVLWIPKWSQWCCLQFVSD